MRDRSEPGILLPMEMIERLRAILGNAYEIDRELEGGGMARVFLAEERGLGRRIVVKTLADDFGTAMSAERFRREIRLAASLQQANIVPVHTAGEADGIPYYTMPFVEGESLRYTLDRRGPLEPREAVGILRDIARALSYAHGRGVIHRDIKPENVLLSGSTAVVTDFGIAKAIEAAHTTLGALTAAGTPIGTPAYMAPEQAAAEPAADHRADLYAWGVLAYELLTGAPPFTARSAPALLAAHLTQQPVPLAARRPGTPRELAALVMRCLEKDPASRPSSADDLLEALERALVPEHAERLPTIAVLPFANLSPDPADEYFADGLTDELITDLATIQALRVIARASMMCYKGSAKAPEAVAAELGATHALDGSVRRAGDSLRLTVRLIDASDGSTLWSEKLGGKLQDVFEMQEQVSRTIVEALRIELSAREDRRLAERPIADIRAYDAFLQARQAMWFFTPDSLQRAIRLLDTTLELVGESGMVLGAMAHAHVMFLETGETDGVDHLAEAERCLGRLATVAPGSFELDWIQGLLHFKRGGIRESIAALERARSLQPSNADVTCMVAYMYLLAGRDEAARRAAEISVELDPLTPLFRCMVGFCAWMRGSYEEALPYYREYLEKDPLNPSTYLFLAIVAANGGRDEEALEAAAALAGRFADTAFGDFGATMAHALAGDFAAARAAVTPRMRSAGKQAETLSRLLAEVLALSGAHDEAIDSLEDALRGGLAHHEYLARHGRLLAPLRSHPRFRRLLDTVRERAGRGGASISDHAAG